MPAITLAEAQSQLAAWLAASKAVANNQSYKIGDRELTRVNAAWINQQILYWEQKVTQLENLAAGRPARARARPVVFG
jgi:hypothetical protein